MWPPLSIRREDKFNSPQPPQMYSELVHLNMHVPYVWGPHLMISTVDLMDLTMDEGCSKSFQFEGSSLFDQQPEFNGCKQLS